jgi:hypothetical protein
MLCRGYKQKKEQEQAVAQFICNMPTAIQRSNINSSKPPMTRLQKVFQLHRRRCLPLHRQTATACKNCRFAGSSRVQVKKQFFKKKELLTLLTQVLSAQGNSRIVMTG